jgi:hypothetical protein
MVAMVMQNIVLYDAVVVDIVGIQDSKFVYLLAVSPCMGSQDTTGAPYEAWHCQNGIISKKLPKLASKSFRKVIEISSKRLPNLAAKSYRN